MYANIMISISRPVWNALSPDARDDLHDMLVEFIGTMSDELGRWDSPIADTEEMVVLSASAFDEDDDEVA